jgi:hypothetical protein
MNMIPSILQPVGAVEVEQQEVAIQSDLSVQAAEDNPEDDASVVAAVAAIIDDGAAGVVDGVLGQETEDTAPPHQSSPHHLPTLVAPESEELELQLVQQHPRARRKRWLPSVAKVPVSRSPGEISSMSSSMMNREKH